MLPALYTKKPRAQSITSITAIVYNKFCMILFSFDFNILEPYQNVVDFFLFDTKTSLHGGSGETFNWDKINQYKLEKPFFLSGGLSLDNLASVKNINNDFFYGVDLNSKFELEPGLKDIEKLKQAFNLIRN